MAPKKSSKASSPSWRTLRRQANMAPTSAQAAALIKEANRLRRAKRAKTKAAAKAGPKKRTRKAKPSPRLVADMNRLLNPNVAGAPAVQTQGWSPLPTHEEQIIQNRAEEIATLARSKRDSKMEIVRRFECWNRIAELNGRKEAEESHEAIVKNLLKQQGINVVAGFVAEVNAVAKANGGPLPRSMVVSGYVLSRVIHALTEAGYTEDGFKSDGIRRLDRESVVNEMVANRTRR